LITVDVKAIQEALNKKGAAVKVDGLLGPETHKAISKFQADNGLVVDGFVGPKTRAALRKWKLWKWSWFFINRYDMILFYLFEI